VSFFDEVERAVRGFSADGVDVAEYRLALEETVRSQLGIESNRTGSPYAPLTTSELSGGSFLVQWSDGLVSRGSLSRAPRDALEEVLRSALEGRYEDREEANFPGEADVPDVPLHSPETAALAEGEMQGTLPAALEALTRVQERHEAAILDGSVRASRSRRRVVSSGGFRAETESTSFGFSVGFDSLVWDGHADRQPISIEEIAERAERTAQDFESLRSLGDGPPRGRCPVILHPRVAEEFIRTFLFSNLSGGAVANGRSRFTGDDFRTRRVVFREDLRIASRPLEPMGIGSFACTGEGVPAREIDFVRDGRLETPILGLKHARRLSMDPAPAPAAIEGYEIDLGEPLTREEALQAGERCVLVHAVLGLHTQDVVRGEYSVLVPQGALHVGGECRGRVSATLSGSFFEDLSSPSLRPVTFPGHACPGLLLNPVLS
jgi:predicted Zn-dependent protease